jgi:hypothetical protein
MNKPKVLVEEIASKPRVDREAGYLRDVLVLGAVSKNKVVYPSTVREKAVPLFEGARVNLSHTADRSIKALNQPTSFERRVGKLTELRNTPEGVRGNLKLLKKHPWAEVIFESAEESPDLFGLSPVMLGLVGGDDGKGNEICGEIQKVKSVDIVADPGTTRSFFEDTVSGVQEAPRKEISEELAPEPTEETPEASAEQHYEEACRKAILEYVDEVFAGSKTPEEAAKSIKEHLKTHLKMHEKEAEAEAETEEAEMEEQERQELTALRTEKACRLLIEEAGMTADKELIDTLSELPTDESRKRVLNKLKLAGTAKKPRTASAQPIPPQDLVSVLRS